MAKDNIVTAADLLLDLAPGTVDTGAVSSLATLLDLRNEIGLDPEQAPPEEPPAQAPVKNHDREHAENFLALLTGYVVAFDWDAAECLTEVLEHVRAEGHAAGLAEAGQQPQAGPFAEELAKDMARATGLPFEVRGHGPVSVAGKPSELAKALAAQILQVEDAYVYLCAGGCTYAQLNGRPDVARLRLAIANELDVFAEAIAKAAPPTQPAPPPVFVDLDEGD